MLCSMDVVVREGAALAARSRKLQRHQDDRRHRSESSEPTPRTQLIADLRLHLYQLPSCRHTYVSKKRSQVHGARVANANTYAEPPNLDALHIEN